MTTSSALCSIVTLLGLAFAGLASTPAHAQKSSLENWATQSGRCQPSDLENLRSKSADGGFTVSTQPTEIFTASGLSPSRVVPPLTIPAMTGLRCHAREGDKLLVSGEDEGYCGWVIEANLLGGAKDGRTVFGTGDSVCGNVAPLPIRQFCERREKLGKAIRECSFPWVRSSPFETKFLVWNADARGERTLEGVEVPLFRSADAKPEDSFRKVKVFNVLRVFDIKRGPQGKLRYLVGGSPRRMEGWIDEDAGTPWYSKLSLFFAKGADKQVLFDEPSVQPVRPLASKPDNLADMLGGKAEFRRYPVLVDRRQRQATDPPGKRPHLEMAFIGAFCQERRAGQMCATTSDGRGSSPDKSAVLERADILFLVDATKSMQPYFNLVARAVRDVAADYKGSTDYHFGVALYGDHTVRGATRLRDKLQFRFAVQLGLLAEGTEFDRLKDEPMYLDDAQGDLEESLFAALLRAIQETPWRGVEPRFVIHVADHGDRIPQVPPELLKLLREGPVFYMPVAVRGSYDAKANALFVDQMRDVFRQHRTPSGLPIGTEVQKTYSQGATSPRDEYDAIARALKGAIDQGKRLREQILNERLRRTPQATEPVAGGSPASLYPPGYAKMLEAARELFGIKVDTTASFPIAARGYVETAELDQPESNWEYFAAIRPQEIDQLHRGFDDLCGFILETNAARKLEQAVKQVIAVLTGDEFKTDADFRKYFEDRAKIPLSTQTMLGAGILELARDLNNPSEKGLARVASYQREVCRTEALIRLVKGGQKLARPHEGQDLQWVSDRRRYNYRNSSQYNWVYNDDFGEATTYLPLAFLPRPPREVP